MGHNGREKGSSNGFSSPLLSLCEMNSQWRLPLLTFFAVLQRMFCLSFCHFHFNFHSHAAHAVSAVICLFLLVCVFVFCFAHHIRRCHRPLANCFRSTILIVIVIDAIFRFGACLSMSAKAKANEPRITVHTYISRTYHTNVAHLLQMWRPLNCSFVAVIVASLLSI